MLGMKGKSGDVERVKASLREIQEQISRCKAMICECDVDLEKYDSIMNEMRTHAEGESSPGDLRNEVNVVQEKEHLLEKEQKLICLSEKIIELEAEYQKFIEEKKRELHQPGAELSRIKVEVKRRKEEIEEISFEQELEKIPSFINNAEQILRNLHSQSEQEQQMVQNVPREIPIELIEHTKKLMEEDEKKLYAVRKAVHAAKENLSFMEFRFPELDRMMARLNSKELGDEWGRLQQEKQVCERYVNEQLLLARRASDRLFEVQKVVEQPEKLVESSVAVINVGAEEELQRAVDYMKDKMRELQNALLRFMEKKEMWRQEFSAMEMELEELWRNL